MMIISITVLCSVAAYMLVEAPFTRISKLLFTDQSGEGKVRSDLQPKCTTATGDIEMANSHISEMQSILIVQQPLSHRTEPILQPEDQNNNSVTQNGSSIPES